MKRAAPIKPTISLNALDQIDIRVGTIELAEDVQGSDKLVRLTADFGDHKRSILTGWDEAGVSKPEGNRREAGAICRQSRTQEDDGGNL